MTCAPRTRLLAGLRAVAVAACVVACYCRCANKAIAQGPVKWTIPVRVIPAPAAASRDAANPRPTAASAAPTTSLPPQYDTVRSGRVVNEAPIDSGTLRFLVSLADRPLLVEAIVTIDGQPFPAAREKRIDQLLGQLTQAAPASSAVASADDVPPSAEAQEPAKTPESPAESVPDPNQSFVARLQRYAAATQRTPSREELRWFLQRWADGPTLLLLDSNYQRVRANTSPLFKVLDRDEDGILSSGEISAAEEALWKYDTNQDELLSLAEITTAATRTPDSNARPPLTPPLIPIEQLVHSGLWQRLREHYQSPLPQFDLDADGVISPAELAEALRAPPELTVQVGFDSRDGARSRIDVLVGAPALSAEEPTVRETALTLHCGQTLLELSAIQAQNLSDVDQISLGAVRDGFPLLPAIDSNEDGRLTVRELRQVSAKLASFDRDHDGQILAAELLPTIRVSVGLGPTVHRQLATVRSGDSVTPTAADTPPEWFTRMDRNRDGDLTPREFLGGKDQFSRLDADHDGLVTIAEAKAGEN